MSIAKTIAVTQGYAEASIITNYSDSQWWWFGYSSGMREMQSAFNNRSYTLWMVRGN